jgi:Xaa-Pro aminopeptidase
MDTASSNKSDRHRLLREAEVKAIKLFEEVERRALIRAGITEKTLNTEVYQLAFEMYGIKKYWHKRIVRAGPNTLHPYRENPPDLLISEDDILFFDFGPVFEDWEADFGRTFVLGNDPHKLKIQSEIEEAWYNGKTHFNNSPDITGAELYSFILEMTTSRGWEYPQAHCGHLIGNFPHEKIQGEELENYIHPDNRKRMRDPDKNGVARDWILEIHFIDRERQIGGFFEQLLTVD